MEAAVASDTRQSLFHKVDYTIGHLVNAIEIGEIGLPELQRPFVWDRTKVRDLFDSMFRGFPVGFVGVGCQLAGAVSARASSRPTGTVSCNSEPKP